MENWQRKIQCVGLDQPKEPGLGLQGNNLGPVTLTKKGKGPWFSVGMTQTDNREKGNHNTPPPCFYFLFSSFLEAFQKKNK